MSAVEFNDKELKKLIKKFSEKMPSIKVGILGEKASRGNESLNNAEIGAFHEFGTDTIPMRSFLRMPIETKLAEEIAFIKMGKGASVNEMAYEIGQAAVDVITGAFATCGYGQWSPSKENGDTLIETGQLQESINFEIEL